MKQDRIRPLFFILLTFFADCHSPNPSTLTVPTLTIGIQNSPSNSLIIIAAKKAFFDSSKVRVSVKEFSAGKLALQALLGQAGDLDVAVCAETPIALSSLGGNKVKIFSEIVNAKNECRVVARREGNADTPEKYFLKKRKLTTSQGGSPEWLTYNFINHYRLDKRNIEIIAMLPENMPVALSNNAVDAISIFDPFARIGEKELGDKGITFYNSDITSYYVLAVKENIQTQKNEALEELIRGLIKAQEFIKTSPAEAMKIVADQTKLDISIIKETWNNYAFAVQLDRALVDLCSAEANWAIETGKYPKNTKIPDFNAVIDTNILIKVAPEAVKL